MLQIDEEALKPLAKMIAGAEPDSAIRIAIIGGPDGVGLGLMLDKQTEADTVITHKEIPFIIDQKLMEYCGSITISHRDQAQSSCSCGQGGNEGFLIVQPENSL